MSSAGFSVRRANWSCDSEALQTVRKQVFIDEQQVPIELEWDGLDKNAIHLLAVDSDNKPIGTGRLLPSGQVGRMAVVASWRKQGVGSELLSRLIELAPAETVLFLNAQITAVEFYQRHHFKIVGEQFLEAGIIHYRMEVPGCE